MDWRLAQSAHWFPHKYWRVMARSSVLRRIRQTVLHNRQGTKPGLPPPPCRPRAETKKSHNQRQFPSRGWSGKQQSSWCNWELGQTPTGSGPMSIRSRGTEPQPPGEALVLIQEPRGPLRGRQTQSHLEGWVNTREKERNIGRGSPT